MRRNLIAVGLLLAVAASGIAQAQESVGVRLTYYLPTGNVMYGGQMPYYGAAACSWGFELGTRLRLPDGFTVTCADRGMLGGGQGWVDLYAPTPETGRDFVRRYGDRATVEVVR